MTLARRTPGYRSTDAHYPKECSIFGGLRDQGRSSRAGLNILTSCSRRRFLRLKIAAWRCELETLIAGCDVSPAYRHLRSWTGLARIRLRLRALSALSRAQRGLA